MWLACTAEESVVSTGFFAYVLAGKSRLTLSFSCLVLSEHLILLVSRKWMHQFICNPILSTHGTAYLAIFYLQAWCIFVKYENCHITLSVLGQIFWLNCNGRSFDEIMKMLGSNKLCGQVYRNTYACQDLFLRTCSKSLVKKEPEVPCLKGAHRYVWHLDPCAQ